MELTEAPSRIDLLTRAAMDAFPRVDAPVEHRFTPGLYTRIITMKKGSLIVSKIHRTCHPFFVLIGHCEVWSAATGWKTFRGGDSGITQPGTQRVLLIHEDTVWATAHVTDLTDVEAIEEAIIEPHDNPLMPPDYPIITASGEWSDTHELEEVSP